MRVSGAWRPPWKLEQGRTNYLTPDLTEAPRCANHWSARTRMVRCWLSDLGVAGGLAVTSASLEVAQASAE
jgi:hypothetical protein